MSGPGLHTSASSWHTMWLMSGRLENPGSSSMVPALLGKGGMSFGEVCAAPCTVDKFLYVAEEHPGLAGHQGWLQIPTAHALGWFSELPLWFCSSSRPVGVPQAPCRKVGERTDIMESLTMAQLALGVKGPPTDILFVLLSLSGSLAEAGKQGLYKQSIKAIVFWAMNRSGESCFLSPICCIVDPFRQDKGLHKKQGPATCFSIVWV